MFRFTFHWILAHLYFFVGDCLCHFDTDWTASLYQFVMQKSCKHDEKIGFRVWKEYRE